MLFEIIINLVQMDADLSVLKTRFGQKKWYHSLQKKVKCFVVEQAIAQACKNITDIKTPELDQLAEAIGKNYDMLISSSTIINEQVKAYYLAMSAFHLLFKDTIPKVVNQSIAFELCYLIRAHQVRALQEFIEGFGMRFLLAPQNNLMFSSGLIKESEMNIEEYPEFARDPSLKINAVTIGDLHGNALKLLHFLLTETIIGLSKDQFDVFAACYYTLENHYFDLKACDDLQEQHALKHKIKKVFKKTMNLIDAIAVIDEFTLVRLIGDELADRGCHDWLTLKILERLPNLEIILSNHTYEFLKSFYVIDSPYFLSVDTFGTRTISNSVENLRLSFNDGLISIDSLTDIVTNKHTPKLKLISYAISRNDPSHITLYTHAPCNFTLIAAVANYFSLDFEDSTLADLMTTIDNINSIFCEIIVDNHDIDLLNTQCIFDLLWNRDHSIERPNSHNGYTITYVHGHDTPEEVIDNSHVNNLDGTLGKTHYDEDGIVSNQEGEYVVYRSYEHVSFFQASTPAAQAYEEKTVEAKP